MPNTPKNTTLDTSTINNNQEDKKLVMPNNEDSTIVPDSEKTSSIVDSTDLPVLAKDSYYLSRLERELARAAVNSKSPRVQITIKPTTLSLKNVPNMTK